MSRQLPPSFPQNQARARLISREPCERHKARASASVCAGSSTGVSAHAGTGVCDTSFVWIKTQPQKDNRTLRRETHRKRGQGVINMRLNSNSSCSFSDRQDFVSSDRRYWTSLLGHLNGTKPSLMLLVTPVLRLLWQVKMCAVKKRAILVFFEYFIGR